MIHRDFYSSKVQQNFKDRDINEFQNFVGCRQMFIFAIHFNNNSTSTKIMIVVRFLVGIYSKILDSYSIGIANYLMSLTKFRVYIAWKKSLIRWRVSFSLEPIMIEYQRSIVSGRNQKWSKVMWWGNHVQVDFSKNWIFGNEIEMFEI